jgi:hypothetical protein
MQRPLPPVARRTRHAAVATQCRVLVAFTSTSSGTVPGACRWQSK